MSQQKQQNEPSGAAMEAAKMILYDRSVLSKSFMDVDEKDIAINIDAAMKPEREAAEKLRIVADALVHAPLREHLSIQFPELAKARMELIQALAAHEAARGK